VSDDVVANSRVAREQGAHAARGGAPAARQHRARARIQVADGECQYDGDCGASSSDARSDDSDPGTARADREVYSLPDHALGCCISAVDVPPRDFMQLEPGDTGDGPTTAAATVAHSRTKRRRAQQVVEHHLAVSLAITLWRLVRAAQLPQPSIAAQLASITHRTCRTVR
jgi:hypothetical protein